MVLLVLILGSRVFAISEIRGEHVVPEHSQAERARQAARLL